MLKVSSRAKKPPSTGETNQLATISPSLSHCTASMPTAATPTPTTAPTIECVVDTGQPRIVATISQTAAASSAASMPSISNSGIGAKTSPSMIPFEIVEATPPPAR